MYSMSRLTSGQIHFVSLHLNRHGTLERFYGNHQLSLLMLQHAFQSIQAPATDSDATPGRNEGVKGKWNFLLQEQLQI